jgi:hypothetical protein
MEEAQPLKVVVKAPDGSVPDFDFDCGADWTVSVLKGAIHDAHPSRPEPEMQKLVHAGRLLTDNQLLVDALQQVLKSQSA